VRLVFLVLADRVLDGLGLLELGLHLHMRAHVQQVRYTRYRRLAFQNIYIDAQQPKQQNCAYNAR
jgi:hypothetical protein